MICLYGVMWALVVSAIELVATLYILTLLFRYFTANRINSTDTGLLVLKDDSHVKWAGATQRIFAVDLRWTPLHISITLSDRQTITVWRDALSDDKYRQLLMQLRQMK